MLSRSATIKNIENFDSDNIISRSDAVSYMHPSNAVFTQSVKKIWNLVQANHFYSFGKMYVRNSY